MKVFFIFLFFLITINLKANKDSNFFKAEFVYGIDELDQLVSFLQTFPAEDGSFVSPIEKASVPIQIIISPFGVVESVSINGFISIEYRWARRQFSEDYYKKYCAAQAIAICKFSEGLWIPAESGSIAVYDTILHNIVFKWKDQKYDWRYYFEQESDELNFFFTPKLDSINEFYNNPFLFLYGSKPEKNIHSESSSVMYYNFGLEKLKEKKFFIAEKIFRLAYLKNPNNDCLYNLAITQLNLGWKKDACLNLQKLFEEGDEEAGKIAEKHCK